MSFRSDEITGYEDLVQRKLIKTPKETQEVIKGREKQLCWLAQDAFKNHEIRSASPGRWTIAKKYPDGGWTNIYMAEIITCRIGVFVSGDIDSVIFAGGDHGDSDRARLNWAATSSLVGYLDGKARIGFNSSGISPAEEEDIDIAMAEMQDHIFDAYQVICEDVLADDEWEPEIRYDDSGEEIDAPDPRATFKVETGKIECANTEHLAELLKCVDADIKKNREIVVWADAIDSMLDGEPLELVRNRLYDELNEADIGDAGELSCNIGIVTAARVYYAHAACKKLAELLEARDQAEASDNFKDHP